MTEPADQILPAARIGRYELVRVMASGGMGDLYLAHDPGVDRPVVIKLLQDRINSKEARQRFAIEGRAAGRLRHKNIVTVFDVGEWLSRSWIAMEYISGETLAVKIARRVSLSLPVRLRYIEELCSGLDFAHRNGVIHRDVKPPNVMVDDEDLVKILDFGIAHVAESNVTVSGVMVGTPNYMAPEQVTGGAIDARTDVFAVGAVFYELLSYQRAFAGDLVTSVHRIVYEEPTPLAHLTPMLDPRIIRIVERALEKDPQKRYQNLRSMAAEVHAARLGLDAVMAAHTEVATPSPSRSSTPVPNDAALATTLLFSSTRASGAGPTSRRRLLYMAALLMALALGAGVYRSVALRSVTPPVNEPMPVAAPSPPPANTGLTPSTAEPGVERPPSPAETARPSPPPATVAAPAQKSPALPGTPATTPGVEVAAGRGSRPDAAPSPRNVEPLRPEPQSVPSTSVPLAQPAPSPGPPPPVPAQPPSAAASPPTQNASPAPAEEPPKPAQQPSAPPQAAQAAPVVDDSAAIEEVLNEYRRAYEARDLARVQRVFPALPSPGAVGTAFAEAREVLIGMSPPTITVTSPTGATAACRLNQNFVPRVGTARAAPTRNVTFTLRKDGGRWIIVSLR